MENLGYNSDDDSFKHQDKYSNKGLWGKLKNNFSKVSNNTIEKVLTMYYAFRDEETPAWAKSVIAGALGYFIFPIDAVPDIIPVLGYTDDLSILIAAIAALGFNIKDKHKEKAQEVINKWYSNLNK